MPQPFDDDSTIRLIPPASSAWKSPRVRTVAASILVVALALAGGWYLWPSPSLRIGTPTVGAPSPAVATGQGPMRPDATVATVAALTPTPQATSQRETPLGETPSVPATEPITTSMAEPPVAGTPPAPAPDEPAHPAFHIETATEQEILDHVPAEGAADPAVFRFRSNPRILVLDFASLLGQGHMLNRVAALTEKTGLPHDRLLTSSELDSAVRAGGDTVETFYYGHDYGVPELIRFFVLGDRDDVRLAGEEVGLRRLIRQEGWFEPNARAALISIPQVGADKHVTRAARNTILHHELSHGEYFTNPGYAAVVHLFWTQTLTAAERERIQHHLQSLGYDSALEEVMENEAQAYLMFTYGADFFTPDMVAMSKARIAELRSGFFRAMPKGWLRESLGQFLSVNRSAAVAIHP